MEDGQCNLGEKISTTLLLAQLIVLVAAQARSEVIISEIMYHPDAANQSDLEWIEIYNAGSQSVDLGGWTLEDLQDGQVSSAFPAGLSIDAEEAIVLTGNVTAFDSNWQTSRVRRVQLGDFPTWANSPSLINETVGLRDQLGTVRDAVNYDDQGSWPQDDGGHGASIFLRPDALNSLANDQGENWFPAMPGVYGNVYVNGGGLGENQGSPGFVATTPQSEFGPSADAIWAIAVLPDTQNYAKSSVNRSVLTTMTEWLRDQRDAWNIQLVLHEGDIVNNNNNTNSPSSGNQTSTEQWMNAKASLSVLDGELPYVLATGNHDHGTTNAQDRSTRLNDFFSAADNPLVDPQQGGILRGTMEPGRLENAYYELDAPDGRQLLVVSLEWGPRQEAVEWANRVVEQSRFSEHTAILLTHSYTDNDNTRTTTANTGGVAGNAGEDLWDELVRPNPNFEFVFSGHIGGDGLGYIESLGEAGNTVHQMLFNSQFETRGGNGWIRLLEFLDDGQTVRLRTVSPLYGLERTTEENNRLLDISALPGFTADFDHDGSVDEDDLQVWLDSYAFSNLADTDEDSDSDGTDFLGWQLEASISSTSSSATTLVPEPWNVLQTVMAKILLCAFASRILRPYQDTVQAS